MSQHDQLGPRMGSLHYRAWWISMSRTVSREIHVPMIPSLWRSLWDSHWISLRDSLASDLFVSIRGET